MASSRLRRGKFHDNKMKRVHSAYKNAFPLLLSSAYCAFASPDHQEATEQQAQREHKTSEKAKERKSKLEEDGKRWFKLSNLVKVTSYVPFIIQILTPSHLATAWHPSNFFVATWAKGYRSHCCHSCRQACLCTIHYTEKLVLVLERKSLQGIRVFVVGRLKQYLIQTMTGSSQSDW